MTTDIRLITFDLDDTLWDNFPVMMRAENIVYQRLCEYWPDVEQHFDFKGVITFRRQLMGQRSDLKMRITALRHYSLTQVLISIGCPETRAGKIASSVMEEFMHWRHEVDYFPDTEAVLAQLSKHYKIGAVTNGNVDIKRLPVGRYFDFAIRAEEYNSEKPEPTLFLKALEMSGAEPGQTLHVGDCLNADVSGARALGINTAWFNPGQKDLPPEHQPDVVIRSLTELLDFLGINPSVAETG
ncbi:MAG: HAD family hydrolase [Endozoicomonas sp.]